MATHPAARCSRRSTGSRPTPPTEARQMDAAGSPPAAGGASAGCVSAMAARAARHRRRPRRARGPPRGPDRHERHGRRPARRPCALLDVRRRASSTGADASWAACRGALLAPVARGPGAGVDVGGPTPCVWARGASVRVVAGPARTHPGARRRRPVWPSTALDHRAAASWRPAAGPGVVPPTVERSCSGSWWSNRGNVDEHGRPRGRRRRHRRCRAHLRARRSSTTVDVAGRAVAWP